MKKRFISILFILVCIVMIGIIGCKEDDGNNGDDWQGITFGGYSDDGANDILETSDGGYIIVGSTSSYGSGLENIYLIKFDSQLNMSWSNTIGGSSNSYSWGNSVQQTSDGDYIMSGGTNIYGWTSYLVKADENGVKIWDKDFDGPATSSACVREISGGGYIAVSERALLKTDTSGTTSWEKSWLWYRGRGVVQASDNNYIVAGITNSADTGDIYIEKRSDSDGNIVWGPMTYGFSVNSFGSIQNTSDSGYIVAASSSTTIYLLKTDSTGTQLWYKTFNGLGDTCGSVQQTSDDGYIITGSVSSNVYLLKTDSYGNQIWYKTYGGSGEDTGNSVIQTSDGGYIIAGSTDSAGAGNLDVYIIKTDSSGTVQ